MSIRDNLHYEMYKVSDVKPDWIINERYEYCEDFYGSIKEKAKGGFKRFVSMLHSLMF